MVKIVSDNDRQCPSCVNLRDRLYAQTERYVILVKKYGQLKKMIVDYAQHEVKCSILKDFANECDCGLHKLKDEHQMGA